MIIAAGDLTFRFPNLIEPIIVAVVTNPSKFPCPTLQASASLALAKFMLIR